MPVGELASVLAELGSCAEIRVYDGIGKAVDGAWEAAGTGDCVLVFGSFTTVESALRRIQPLN
jgi:folylpolyglutamate synthase/dihydropteroate synthase